MYLKNSAISNLTSDASEHFGIFCTETAAWNINYVYEYMASPLPRNVTAHIEIAQLMAIHARIHEQHAFWMVAVTHSSCMQLYVHATSLCDCWFNGMSYSCCSRAECRPAGLSQSRPRRVKRHLQLSRRSVRYHPYSNPIIHSCTYYVYQGRRYFFVALSVSTSTG